MLSKKDFAMSGEQHRFKIKCKCAILTQKSARRDSIVSILIPQFVYGDFFDSIDPKATSAVRVGSVCVRRVRGLEFYGLRC
jgi:hypothetical protein